MHILYAYIFKVRVNQQLHGRACWCRMRGLRTGAAVKFRQVELWKLTLNKRSFVRYYKFRSQKLQYWELN